MPKTWVIPTEMHDLRNYMENAKGNPMLICKPYASCQGKGIFMTRKLNKIPKNKTFVVQKYLKSPCLLDELKFDL